jgi:hypothetical protein
MSIATDLAKREETKTMARRAAAETLSGAALFAAGTSALLEVPDAQWRRDLSAALLPPVLSMLKIYHGLCEQLIAGRELGMTQ